MPFTLSHPAAVLPLGRLGVPMVPLVIGSMVPDLPVFAGDWSAYRVTHSAAGVLTVDVLAAVGMLAVWSWLLRDALVDLSPDPVRERLAARAPLSRRQWALAPLAAVLGSTTHVVWDLFTHPGRWGVRHLAWLHEVHLGLPGHVWAQYASGVLGLVVLGWAAMRHLRRLPRAPRLAPRALSPATLPGVVLGAAACGLLAAFANAHDGLRMMAFAGAVNSVIGLAAFLVMACSVWRVNARVTA